MYLETMKIGTCQICFNNKITPTNSIIVCNNCKFDNRICIECYTRLPKKSCPFCLSPVNSFYKNNKKFGKKFSIRKWYELMNVKLNKCNHELSSGSSNYNNRTCNYTHYPLCVYCLCHFNKSNYISYKNIQDHKEFENKKIFSKNYERNIKELLRYAFMHIINIPSSEECTKDFLFLSKKYDNTDNEVENNKKKIKILKWFHSFIYSNIEFIKNNDKITFEQLEKNFWKNTIRCDKENLNEQYWCKYNIFWNYNEETNTITYLKNIF